MTIFPKDTLIHDPKNQRAYPKLWAWLSVDADGNEGICATGTVDTETGFISHMPLVTGDERRVPLMQRMADEMAGKSKDKKVIMAVFERIK